MDSEPVIPTKRAKYPDPVPVPKRSRKILCVCTSQSSYGQSDKPTGIWLEEITHFLHSLIPAGFEYDIMSPKGGKIPIDPSSGSRSDKINYQFSKNTEFLLKLNNSLTPAQINPENYIAIYYAGGYGPMWDFPNDERIAEIAAKIYESGKHIIAICHGVIGLLPIKLSNGHLLLSGKEVTGFSNSEESIAGDPKKLPFSVESELKAKGATYNSRWPFLSNVVTSERLITGQNPQSTKELGSVVTKVLLQSLHENPPIAKASTTQSAQTKSTGFSSIKVLVVCTSFGLTGNGLWLEELTDFIYILIQSGIYQFDIASPKGGKVPLDQKSIKNDRAFKAVKSNEKLSKQMENSIPLDLIKPLDYAVVYLTGGHGTMFDFPGNERLQYIVRTSIESHAIVCANCHGVCGLLNVKLSNGKSLIEGRQITGFSNAEETIILMRGDAPFLIESKAIEIGAKFSTALVPFTSNIVSSITASGTLITGQNPASTKGLAKAVMKRLNETRGRTLQKKVSDSLTIHELFENVWVFSRPFTFKLLEIGLNTVIVKTEDNKLFVYNPSSLDDSLVINEVKARGEVAYVMTGSVNHHFSVRDWVKFFPEAKLIPTVGVEPKKPEINWVKKRERALIDKALENVFEFFLLETYEFDETVLFHKPSKTLIMTDVFLHFTSGAVGVVTGYDKLLLNETWKETIRDPEKVSATLLRIFSTDFQRIILAHGHLFVHPDIKEAFAKAINEAKIPGFPFFDPGFDKIR